MARKTIELAVRLSEGQEWEAARLLHSQAPAAWPQVVAFAAAVVALQEAAATGRPYLVVPAGELRPGDFLAALDVR